MSKHRDPRTGRFVHDNVHFIEPIEGTAAEPDSSSGSAEWLAPLMIILCLLALLALVTLSIGR